MEVLLRALAAWCLLLAWFLALLLEIFGDVPWPAGIIGYAGGLVAFVAYLVLDPWS